MIRGAETIYSRSCAPRLPHLKIRSVVVCRIQIFILIIFCLANMVLTYTNKWVVEFQPGAGAIGPLGYVPIDT